MAVNDYSRYYTNQAGNGLAGFEGYRFQKGYGFFGRIFKTFAKPLMGYLGRKALRTGRDIVEDVLGGKNLKSASKRRVMDTIGDMGSDVSKRFAQSGSGFPAASIKRKRARPKRPVARKTRRKRKTKRKTAKRKTVKRKVKKRTVKRKTKRAKATSFLF